MICGLKEGARAYSFVAKPFKVQAERAGGESYMEIWKKFCSPNESAISLITDSLVNRPDLYGGVLPVIGFQGVHYMQSIPTYLQYCFLLEASYDRNDFMRAHRRRMA